MKMSTVNKARNKALAAALLKRFRRDISHIDLVDLYALYRIETKPEYAEFGYYRYFTTWIRRHKVVLVRVSMVGRKSRAVVDLDESLARFIKARTGKSVFDPDPETGMSAGPATITLQEDRFEPIGDIIFHPGMNYGESA